MRRTKRPDVNSNTPKVENVSYKKASSTSSCRLPTYTVRFDFVPSSMLSRGWNVTRDRGTEILTVRMQEMVFRFARKLGRCTHVRLSQAEITINGVQIHTLLLLLPPQPSRYSLGYQFSGSFKLRNVVFLDALYFRLLNIDTFAARLYARLNWMRTRPYSMRGSNDTGVTVSGRSFRITLMEGSSESFLAA
jgi:hypothetical protein